MAPHSSTLAWKIPWTERPLRGLQETRVATREESGVLGFPSRRGLTPRGSLAPHERLPEILVVPREKTPTGAAARGNP